MLTSTRLRIPALAARLTRIASRPATTASPGTGENREQANDPTPPKEPPNISKTNEVGVTTFGAHDGVLQESAQEGERQRQLQAPNRSTIWSRSQQPRDKAMTGPRFEQTIMEHQPQPYAAIELIHKQPVRWTHNRVVACDGGGGPLGHPRIFINTDKPQVCMCTYCGLPFANEHHRKYLESLPSTSYPLKPTGDPVEVGEPQKVTDEPLAQR